MSSQSHPDFKVKLFLDGAERAVMLEHASNPKTLGFTTNPTLMKKAGVKDYRAFCLELLPHLNEKPVSFEVFADDFTEMKRQALEISKWGSNVYVKIPITNSENSSAIPLIKELVQHKIKLNVTAIMTLSQVWETAQALKGRAPSIVSVFAGRIADTGRDPMPIMKASSELCRETDPNIELLWASSREPLNIIQADQTGCHIITVSPDILKKLPLFGKSLQTMSLDTVKTFKFDAESAGFSL